MGRVDLEGEAAGKDAEVLSGHRSGQLVEPTGRTPDHAKEAVAARDGLLTRRSVTALQRAVGNRATSTVVQRRRIPLQRAVTTDVEEGVDKLGELGDVSGGQVGQWSSGAQFGMVQNPNGSGTVSNYTTGNISTPGAIGGITGSGLGMGAGITSTVLSSIGAEEGRRTKAEEKRLGRKGWAKWRVGHRAHKSGATTATTSAVGVAASTLEGLSGISQVMANAGSTTAFASANNLLGGIGGIIAMPLSAFQIGRTAWKLSKQVKRFNKLRTGMVDPTANASEAKKAFENHVESINLLKETKTELEAAMQTNRGKVGTYKVGSARRNALQRGWIAMNNSLAQVNQKIAQLDLLTTQLETAKNESEQKVQEMANRAQAGQESAEDIQLYARTKSQGGMVKKSIGIISGALGLGGGIAATIGTLAFASVGIATSVAVAATPVGWALGGLAALAGLALAGYGFWKWFSKRLNRAKKQEGLTGAKAFFTALNPFKKVGTSHREHMAQRLWDLGNSGSPAEKTKAKDVIEALGLKWDELHMDDPSQKESAVKLIHDKMAS